MGDVLIRRNAQTVQTGKGVIGGVFVAAALQPVPGIVLQRQQIMSGQTQHLTCLAAPQGSFRQCGTRMVLSEIQSMRGVHG